MRLIAITLAVWAVTASARVVIPPPDADDMREYCDARAAGARSLARWLKSDTDKFGAPQATTEEALHDRYVDRGSSPTEDALNIWTGRYVGNHFLDNDVFERVQAKCMKNARNVLMDMDSNRRHVLK
jgi:hypothetical protein